MKYSNVLKMWRLKSAEEHLCCFWSQPFWNLVYQFWSMGTPFSGASILSLCRTRVKIFKTLTSGLECPWTTTLNFQGHCAPPQGPIEIPSWLIAGTSTALEVGFRKGELCSEEKLLHGPEFSSCEFYTIITERCFNSSELKKAERSSVCGISPWHLPECVP